MNRHVLVLLVGVCAPAAWLLVACSGSTVSPDADDASTSDSSTLPMLDGAVGFDATGLDAATSHAEAAVNLDDAGVVDSSAPHDSGLPHDSATFPDSAAPPAPDASDDDASDAGEAFDCGAPPAFHPSTPDAGPYCPFSTASTPFATCAYGQHCCEPPAGTGTLSACESSCSGLAAGGIDWECQDSISCGLGESCCANVTSVVISGPNLSGTRVLIGKK